MKIHHLNCGTFCPVGFDKVKPLFNKITDSKIAKNIISSIRENEGVNFLRSKFNSEEKIIKDLQCLVTHCLLIETADRLILVDTGVGKKLIKNYAEQKILDQFAVKVMGAKLDVLETAHSQIKKLGFSPSDVTDVVISHFDFDHVSGLLDFPNATAHCFKKEKKFVDNNFKSTYNQHRFQTFLWNEHSSWDLHSLPKETLCGLKMGELFSGSELYLTHLPGHTPYQNGLFIKSKNLFFAADSYLHHEQLNLYPKNPYSVRGYQKMTTENEDKYFSTIKKIIKLRNSGIKTFCSHDPSEYHHLKS